MAYPAVDVPVPLPDTTNTWDQITSADWFWPLAAAVVITAGIAIAIRVLGLNMKVLIGMVVVAALTAAVVKFL